ncbi:diguanylate cyclase domain-containing protein [Comamonas testosteroni]|uniref:diguanylate cyclase domain-containing protein n=2 Tax=Comamonas TaxID=283 RepID=UPI0022869CEF|nr:MULTISPECIES: diguanylate cyclase [Comamonas]
MEARSSLSFCPTRLRTVQNSLLRIFVSHIEHTESAFGHITVSIGSATWGPERTDTDMAAVIRDADEVLYNAKMTGRNKVALSAQHRCWVPQAHR